MALSEKQYLLGVIGTITRSIDGPATFYTLQGYINSDPHSPFEESTQLRAVSYLLHQLEADGVIIRDRNGILPAPTEPHDKDDMALDQLLVGTCSACGQELLMTHDDCWHPHNVPVACPPEYASDGGISLPAWGRFGRPGREYFIPNTPNPS